MSSVHQAAGHGALKAIATAATSTGLTAHSQGLLTLISAAVTPVVLISSVAILLGAFTTKYTNIGNQLRELTTEFRIAGTTEARRKVLKDQLIVFHRRLSSIWAACAFLMMSILLFLGTVLSVIFLTRTARIGDLGALFLILGLVCVTAAVVLELYEIQQARLTVLQELADIFDDHSWL